MPQRLMLAGGPAWGLIGAGIVLVGALAFTGRALLECRQGLGTMDGRVESAEGKAETNAAAALDLGARLDACMTERRLDEEAQRAATREHSLRMQELAAEVERERAARDRAAAEDASCAAWRAGVVCQPIADRMRDAAARAGGSDSGG